MDNRSKVEELQPERDFENMSIRECKERQEQLYRGQHARVHEHLDVLFPKHDQTTSHEGAPARSKFICKPLECSHRAIARFMQRLRNRRRGGVSGIESIEGGSE